MSVEWALSQLNPLEQIIVLDSEAFALHCYITAGLQFYSLDVYSLCTGGRWM